MANLLPRFISFGDISVGYLEYVEEEGELHGFLRFTGKEVVSPYTKFEVERAKSSEELVHIRTCYNNKYLVRRSEQGENWIEAGANEPEEDQSKFSCTLIRPQLMNTTEDGDSKFVLQMASSPETYLCSDMSNPKYRSCLVCNRSKEGLTVIDRQSLVVVPKYFALVGDNDRYLSSRWIQNHEYHEFASEELLDRTVHFEAFTLSNGNIRVRSNFFGKFWRRSPNWIWADSTDTTANNRDTIFQPIWLPTAGDNVIALRNLGNNRYCKRLTADRKTSCLNAATDDLEPFARFRLEEAVTARQIYDVHYRIDDARIYNSSPSPPLTRIVNNRSPTNTQKGEVNFSYTETESERWNSTQTWKFGVSTDISTGIPILAKGAISISTEYDGEYEWGSTVERSTEIGTKLVVETPPMTRNILTMLVARGTIDIPFSYTQRDTSPDGTLLPPQRLHDGIFTGINTSVSYDVREESLSSMMSSLPSPAKL